MPVLNLTVGASADDARTDGTNNDAGRNVTATAGVTLTDTILSPGSHNSNDEWTVGARFTAVTIPQGATINSATFSLKAQATYNAGANVIAYLVSAQAADNPGAFTVTGGNLNITNRPRTTAVSAQWTQTSVTGGTRYSIDITSVIQEIVNRAGWTSGNAIVILVDTHPNTTQGEWQDYYAYDDATDRTNNPPQLSIDYTSGGGNVTVGLTGVSATGQVGTVTPTRSIGMAGLSATAALGTLAVALTAALTGTPATTATGTVATGRTRALTGVSSTTAVGTVGQARTVPTTGVAATGQVGTLGTSATSAPGPWIKLRRHRAAMQRRQRAEPAPRRHQRPRAVLIPSADVSVALTGVSATGNTGALGKALSKALTGTAGTGQVGNVGASSAGTVALTGVAATGATGTLGVTRAQALTGTAATTATGTVTATHTRALTGLAGTGAVGTVAPSRTVPLSGVSATGQAGAIGAPAVSGTGPLLRLKRHRAAVQRRQRAEAQTERPRVSRRRRALVYEDGYGIAGVEATGQVGTVGVSRTVALTGVSATGQTGTLGRGTAKALAGVAGTGQVGTVTVAGGNTAALTGVAATTATGTVGASRTVALAGVAGTGQVGNLGASAAGTASLSGVSATGQAGTLGSSRTVALTGVQATGAVGTMTTGSDVARSLTGVQAAGQAGTLAPAAARALTGTAASGQVGTLTAAPDRTLAGVQAGTATGSVGTARTVALVGVQANGQTGFVGAGADVTRPITGVSASGQVGALTPSPSVTVAGVQAATAIGTLAPERTVALTGVQATGQTGTLGYFEANAKVYFPWSDDDPHFPWGLNVAATATRKMFRGDQTDLIFDDGPVGSVAGWTTELAVSLTPSSDPVLILPGVTIDTGSATTPGQFRVRVTEADSLLLSARTYYYTLRRTAPTAKTLTSGKLQVAPNIRNKVV